MKMRFAAVICSTLTGLMVLSSQAVAQQKTIKACQEEWRANKAANQANGITEKSYVDQCRSANAPIQPTAAPAAPPPAHTAAPTPTPPTSAAPGPTPAATAPPIRSTPSPTGGPASPPQGTPAGTNQFATEAQAKARCPSDTIVWANLKSHIYHFSGFRNYGTTKDGAYMCESDTVAAGFRAPKNEVHP